ncbi:MAG: PHP domain-containing protein [Candidatus Eiseniibacteriota bacterium]
MAHGFVDLHTHSLHSDGTLSPTQVVEKALARGLVALALTDHDSVDGLDEARARADGTGLELIAGVELSAHDGGTEVHVLGYFVDDHDAEFRQSLMQFREQRLLRAHAILERLEELGFDLSWDDVLGRAQGGSIGRPHIAEAMVAANYVSSFDEAFRRFLGVRGSAYIPRRTLTPRGALELVRKAGGVPVIAHPATMERDPLIPEVLRFGLGGVEVIHPRHDESDRRRYQALCDRYDLVATGGSDNHGERSGYCQIGDGDVPFEAVEGLRKQVLDPKRTAS